MCTDSGIRFCYLHVYFLQFDVARRKAELQEKLTSLKYMLSEASLQLLPEYKQRIQVRSVALLLYEPPSFLKQEYKPLVQARHYIVLHFMLSMINIMATVTACCLQVLRHFRFINAYDTVVFKGRVACEVHSHEVLLTELLFQNVFSDYSPAEIAALLSCMVFQQVNP